MPLRGHRNRRLVCHGRVVVAPVPVGGGGFAITNDVKVVVGRGGLTITTAVGDVGGGSVANAAVDVVVGVGESRMTPTAVGLVVGGVLATAAVAVVEGGSATTTTVEVGSGDSALTAAVGVLAGGGGLVMMRPPSDPQPDPKAATRTTGTAEPTRRRNMPWRASLRRTSACGTGLRPRLRSDCREPSEYASAGAEYVAATR